METATALLPNVEEMKALTLQAGEVLLLRFLEAGPAPLLITHGEATWGITVKKTRTNAKKEV